MVCNSAYEIILKYNQRPANGFIINQVQNNFRTKCKVLLLYDQATTDTEELKNLHELSLIPLLQDSFPSPSRVDEYASSIDDFLLTSYY
jgi:hypothetical protein